MRHAVLKDMVKGWFVGDFTPAAVQCKDAEVAIKHYKAGDCEDLHHHRIATEITVVVSGVVEMLGKRWGEGDIVVIEPGEATAFVALSDSITVVVKLPSVAGDKYAGAWVRP